MRQAIILAASLSLLGSPFALAQQMQVAAPKAEEKPQTIFIGQPLQDAVQALRQRGYEFHEGGWEIVLSDRDVSNLTFKVDDDHAFVAVFFSKSKQVVTSISMVFVPQRGYGSKLAESWVAATSIVLYPDTSYAVRFAKPRTKEEIDAAEANRPKVTLPPMSFPVSPGSYGKTTAPRR